MGLISSQRSLRHHVLEMGIRTSGLSFRDRSKPNISNWSGGLCSRTTVYEKEMVTMQQIEVHVLPEVLICGRTYRASNIRMNGSGRKWADVEYWHEGREWREVYNWDRIETVARMLWHKRGDSIGN